MSTTRGAIRLEAAKLLGLWLGSGTATGGSTTTVIAMSTSDNGLVDSSLDATERYKGAYILMTGGTAGNIGQWREISDDTPSTGTETVAKAFPNSVLSGDTFEIYGGLTPGQWSLDDNNSLVDWGLFRTRYMTASPMTLVADGDMEASGVTHWAATNCTRVKSTTETVTFGSQSLAVTNTSGSGYVQSDSIAVRPGGGYTVWASYRSDPTNKSTATLIVWDVTNSAQIATGNDPDSGVNYEGGMTSTSFAAPATCRQVAFRLQGTESNAIIYWDDIIMLSPSRRRYPAPSWIITRNQYMALVQRYGIRPYEFSWADAGQPKRIEEDPTAVTAFMVNLPELGASTPVYLEGERPYGPQTATADSTTTACPLDWARYAAACAAYDRFEKLIEGSSYERERMDRADVEKKLAEANQSYMPWYASSIGFDEPWTGGGVTRMP